MTDRRRKILNGVLTGVYVAALTIFIITFSIGLPIYCRFFYYIQIKTLDLPARAAEWGIDATAAQIREAYDGILDFCTLPGRQFQSGVFAMSEEGIAHFADCKALFNLNLGGIICGGAITLLLLLLNRFNVITLLRPFGHRPQLISAIIAIALPLIIGLLAVIVGFDRAFAAFHAVFFPGKTNWTFDPHYDQIITVMPEEFFLNCAIIIAVGLVAFSLALIAADVILCGREKKRNENKDDEG